MTAAGPSRARRTKTPDQRLRQRELRWENERLAVPYPVDGPKITLGVAWFVVLLGAAYYLPLTVLVPTVGVATAAGLQAGHAWSRQELSDRRSTASVAAIVSASAFFGAFWLGLALVVTSIALLLFAWTVTGASFDNSAVAKTVRAADILARSSLPVGLAAGSLAVLAVDRTAAFVSIVLLVSAYEAGDFLVGSGSANAVEGPLAGLVALALVAVGLYLVLPEPFTKLTLPVFAAVVAVSAPLGQIAASALLPRGNSWAPALRRLDSYLISAPVWVLLVS